MVIGIGGSSNAGKTELAFKIKKALKGRSVKILCQDDYVLPEKQLPRIKDHIDWEHPDTIDDQKFKINILSASKSYDVVIAEGFMVYHNPTINSCFDKRIFIEIPEYTFRTRKTKDLRWGKEPDWYVDHIWRKFLEFGQPGQEKEVFIVDGLNEWPIEEIVSYVLD